MRVGVNQMGRRGRAFSGAELSRRRAGRRPGASETWREASLSGEVGKGGRGALPGWTPGRTQARKW